MAEFLRNIPKPINRCEENIIEIKENKKNEKNKNKCYEYLNRKYLRITCNEDFRDGGSYPEIHINQYPNNLGLKKINKNIVKYIEDNEVKYDNLINEEIYIYNNNIDMTESNDRIKELRKKKNLSNVKDIEEKYNVALFKPNDEEEKEIIEHTKKNIENILYEKLNKENINIKKEPKFYRYIPKNKLNNQLEERIIKVVDKPIDPLEVSKFKHKKMPNIKNEINYPILSLPDKKLTSEEIEQWNIPPCVSNWKNNKGYNIPLDKRIQSDNKKLKNVDVNENFAHLSEYLYAAEKKAREEIRIRNNVLKEKKLKEKEEKEKRLQELAKEAKKEKDLNDKSNTIINQRKREIEREYKIEKNLKKLKNYESKIVEEQIAFNKNTSTSNNIHDISLFHVDTNIQDEDYQIYDTPLFQNKNNSHIYKFSNDRLKKTIEKIQTKENKEPIKFIKEINDPFGLDTLLSEAKKKK